MAGSAIGVLLFFYILTLRACMRLRHSRQVANKPTPTPAALVLKQAKLPAEACRQPGVAVTGQMEFRRQFLTLTDMWHQIKIC